MSTVVLGIGNTLLMDEGVGVHAVRCLENRKDLPEDTCCVDGGTLSFTLAEIVKTDDRLIVVDAAQLQQTPGTIKTFTNDDIDRFLNQGHHRSVHDISLMDFLHILRLTDRLPQQRALVGIQPAVIDWGEKLSGVLHAVFPAVMESLLKFIKEWR